MAIENPKTFRNPPATIEIGEGDKKKQITIGDLPYRKHQELLKLMGNLWVETSAVPQAIARMDLEIQRRMVAEKKTAQEAATLLQQSLSALYMHINDKRIVDIMLLGTNGQLVENDLDLMTSTEVAGIAVFVIERNFEALKNFFASLDSIQTMLQEKPKK